MTAPRLTRTAPAPAAGIVHLGLGAFFRAHGTLYVQQAMAASGGDWGIIGVSLQSPGVRDRLAPQGGCYTLLELGPGAPVARTVTALREVLVAPEDPAAVLAAMADPAIRIVSLTVTEKGYCHAPATGRLNLDHPMIRHDLIHPLPQSAPGYLVRALESRWRRGVRPFTVLCCDNLPQNGTLLRGLVLELAEQIDPALAGWIAAEARFPATMVDRIVPAARPEDLALAEALTGCHDAAPVAHEPFRQWVIEDDFVDGARPDLGAAGAEMVADVTAHEHMKLRMLNGTHSSLAYLGYLAGHETIADCLADPAFGRYLDRLWQAEIIPALTAPPGTDLLAYAAALKARFANPGIRHRTWQIAMDGSQKLPQRILGTVAAGGAAGRPCPGLDLALAAWSIYVRGTGLDGQPIEVRDPLAPRLRAAALSDDPIGALLAMAEVFPPDLSPVLGPRLRAARAILLTRGVTAALEQLP